MRERNDADAFTASRRATLGTLAVLAGLLTLYGCDNAGPVDQAAEQAAQQVQDNAVERVDGTAAGPDPAANQPESAPVGTEKEDPQKP
ncbi:MAG: hypothetical protein BGP21_14010 [Thiobacillus sp. 65-29]|nr:MAG: hypothetical protein BGP21_14010 [Thiobacillus sp. 65-29]